MIKEPFDRESCPGCETEVPLHKHLVTGEVWIDCPNCGFDEHCPSSEPNQENVCPFCENGVFYSTEHSFEGDEKPDSAHRCIDCNRYAHTSCVENNIHSCMLRNGYRCQKCFDYSDCDSCGLLHAESCIVTAGEAAEVLGRLCEECAYGDDSHLTEAVEILSLKIDRIDETSRHYFRAAKAYADASVACTHLIRAQNPEAALSKLEKILTTKKLLSNETGFFAQSEKTKAVCFTEMTIRGLIQHAVRYSPFGIAFPKSYVLEKGGGPALYIPGSRIRVSKIPSSLKPFVNKLDLDNHDFHHEREWRVPRDLDFAHSEILAVFAPRSFHHRIRANFPEIQMLLDLNILALM